MGILSGPNFPDLLEPGLRNIYDNAVNRPRPVLETLYGVQSSTKFQEHYLGLGAIGLVPVYDGGEPEKADLDAGFRTDIQNYQLAYEMQVERQLVDDDMYNVINGRARTLGDSFDITIEHDAAQTFINAFTDSGTNRLGASTNGADSVALCSLVHPFGPVNTGSTQSNEGTLDLNLPNVDTTRQAMMNFTDDKSTLLGVMPDTILIPTELEKTAREIFDTRAQWQPGSAQFDFNMFSGSMRVIVWNRLTDGNAWFLIDSRLMAQHLIFQWRIRPEFTQMSQSNALIARYLGYMRYGLGHTDWKWIYGQNPP